nr:SDR family NAD(P)-dependent oxidoreductase [Coraliomargarita parva]
MVITGGSSGIGRSIIKASLRLKPNLTICNLSRSKPDVFLGENGHHLPTDLTSPSALESSANRVLQLVRQAPSGELILVNNSGFGDYGPMGDLDASKQLKMIDLNVRSLVDLTARLMPALQARGGVVVNLASTAAFQPTPYMSTYGASKAFVLHWSLALNEDFRGTNLRALAVCPGPTRSNFFKAAGFETPPMQGGVNGWLDMSADEVAALTWRAIASGKSVVVTGWKNRLIALVGGKLPKVFTARMGRRILGKLRLEQHRAGAAKS